MSSNAAVVGLTWDGYDVQRSDLNVFLEITEGLDELPDLRSQHQVIPFRHGRRPQAPYADHRVLVLTGLLSGASGTERSDYRGYVDEVKESFSPLRDTPGTLVASLEDGTTRWIKAMPLDMRTERIVPGAANASIELIADDPFWYSADEALAMDAGYLLNDGELMDAGVGEVIVVPASGLVTAIVAVGGTAPVQSSSVVITGPSTSAVRIEHLLTGVGFTGPVLAAGDVLTVDSGARTVRLNGSQARNQISLLAANRKGEYMRLDPGSNTLRISGQPAEVRVRFTSTFL